MEEDSSNLDDEDMAMITRKLKKFFERAKENTRKKNSNKFKNTDREQFSGYFKCGKLDYIVKNYLLLKEEQEPEQAGNSFGRRFSNAMLAA